MPISDFLTIMWVTSRGISLFSKQILWTTLRKLVWCAANPFAWVDVWLYQLAIRLYQTRTYGICTSKTHQTGSTKLYFPLDPAKWILLFRSHPWKWDRYKLEKKINSIWPKKVFHANITSWFSYMTISRNPCVSASWQRLHEDPRNQKPDIDRNKEADNY